MGIARRRSNDGQKRGAAALGRSKDCRSVPMRTNPGMPLRALVNSIYSSPLYTLLWHFCSHLLCPSFEVRGVRRDVWVWNCGGDSGSIFGGGDGVWGGCHTVGRVPRRRAIECGSQGPKFRSPKNLKGRRM
eukprot:4280111-Pyramimonas_sp.AAC.1